MKPREIGEYLVVDPKVCFGRLTFKGTRVPVETILNWLAKGKTIAAILADWPYLTRAAVSEAIFLTADALTQRFENRSKPNHEPVHFRRTTRGQRSSRTSSKTT